MVSRKFSAGKLTVYMFIIALCVTIVVPIWMMLMSSFTEEGELRRNIGLVLYPKQFTTAAYRLVFADSRVMLALQSSVSISVAGTACLVLMTAMAAYPLSKKIMLRTPVGFYFYFTVLFGGGMIPTFLLMRDLKLLNSIWSIILLGLGQPFYIILMRNFFAELPSELEESAMIDGAGQATVLFRIVVPLSLPVMATVSLFAMVAYWNDWFSPMIYMMGARDRWPLSTILQQLLQGLMQPRPIDQLVENTGVTSPKEAFKYATLFITMAPIMCIYPFAQKYFAKGILVGAVKG